MAKATVTLPNGNVVTIEGSPDEVKHLLDYYARREGTGNDSSPPAPTTMKAKVVPREVGVASIVDLPALINHVKACEEAQLIEANILDKSSQVDRALLPLYVVYKYMENAVGLTTGEISKVTAELGIPISLSNVSTALAGAGAKYVVGDKLRKKGMAVRYKLSRRGLQYMESVIRGSGEN